MKSGGGGDGEMNVSKFRTDQSILHGARASASVGVVFRGAQSELAARGASQVLFFERLFFCRGSILQKCGGRTVTEIGTGDGRSCQSNPN